MHASYPDVTAEDFLHVQTDVQYRKIWDRTAVALEVIDTDPLHNSRSHVVYWEMLWPVSTNFLLLSLNLVHIVILISRNCLPTATTCITDAMSSIVHVS